MPVASSRNTERVRYVQNIYHQLKEKAVPHVDTLIHVVDSSIYIEPKGIAVRPSNEKELLKALVCVLSALVVCSVYFEVVACIFTSHYRFSTDHQCYYIETSDGPMFFGVLMIPLCGFSLIGTMLPVPIMSQQFVWIRQITHPAFMDNHGGEVDIWGVGMLIVESVRFAFNVSPKLVDLGKVMMQEGHCWRCLGCCSGMRFSVGPLVFDRVSKSMNMVHLRCRHVLHK